MTHGNEERFQDFFEESRYVALKNSLYNYLLRKRAIEGMLAREQIDMILEVGSGISPVMTHTDRIVYSELSFLACRTLKQIHGKGWYVVADATHLPFRPGAFSHTICSEVLEHIEADGAAVRELASVLRLRGRLFLTFPHRKAFYAIDDRYVEHYRRYERDEMERLLKESGLRPLATRTVLGPLDKLTMMLAVLCFEAILKRAGIGPSKRPSAALRFLGPIFKAANRLYALLLRIEAAIVPQRWAMVLLVVAEKG